MIGFYHEYDEYGCFSNWYHAEFDYAGKHYANSEQPDFIVKFKNGDVGIFDTKPIDYNVEDTKVKAEALWKYISDINMDRGKLPRVIGGIVVKKGGVFYCYNEKEYVDMNEDNTNWKPFSDVIDI